MSLCPFILEAEYPAPHGWLKVVEGGREYCIGYLHGRTESIPRPAMRVRRTKDDKIVEAWDASTSAPVGASCGWPSYQQLRTAAVKCLLQMEHAGHLDDRTPEDREAAKKALLALGRAE